MKTKIIILIALTGCSLLAAPQSQTPPDATNGDAVTGSADKVLKAMSDLETAMGKTNVAAKTQSSATTVELKPVAAPPVVSPPVVSPAPAPIQTETVVAPKPVVTDESAVPTATQSETVANVVAPAAVVTLPPAVVAPAASTNTAAQQRPSRFTRRANTNTAPQAVRVNVADSSASPQVVTKKSEIVTPAMLHFQAMPLEQVLDIYADMVGRTILRPAQLPAATITIKTQTDLTKEEAIQALDTVLGLNGITMIPVGTKFVKAVPQGQANQEGAAINTNSSAGDLPEMGSYITHVVQLRYSKPSVVAGVLGSFSKIQGSVTPLDDNGILIIRDYTENVKRMLELIEQIDVAVPSEFVSEVIPIKYALASDIASALNSVGGGSTGSIGGSGTTATGTTTGRAGANGVNGANGARTTTPFGAAGQQTGANAYNGNRTGTTGGIGGIGTTGGFGGAANNGQAPTFAQRLQTIIARAGANGDFQILGPNKIIPDERTNSLLVFANRQDMEMIKDIVAKLDVVLAQVLIEAVILDVTLGDNFDFGVSAGQRPATSSTGNGTNSIINGIVGGGMNNSGAPLTTGQAFLNSLTHASVTNFGGVGGTNPIVTTIANAINYPSADGLSYFGQIGTSWDVAINALAGDNKGRILARPRIQTSHAVPASIFVGETYPYITGTVVNSVSGGTQSQYSQTQIGITLNVTPLINPEGLVVMQIQQSVQNIGGYTTIDNNQVPITQDQNASATVAVKNGDTIVMGGFIQNQKTANNSGVPLLKDIPLLGALFRSTTTTSSRRELLVLIRPTVLQTPEVAALQPDIERNRLPIVKQAEKEFADEDAKLLKKANKYKPEPEKPEKKDAKYHNDLP